MRYSLILFATLALLAGCANTQQASVQPVVNSVVVAEPAPPAAIATLAVADAAPAKPMTGLEQPRPLEPFQWMMAWTNGVQDALMPWTRTVQACDTPAAKR